MVPQPVLRRVPLVAAALASVLVLAGCAAGSGPIEDYPGLPVIEEETDEGADVESEDESGAEGEEEPEEEIAEPTGDEPFVIYLNDGGRLAITLWGSSTCPVVPTELRVTAEAGEGNAVEAILPEPEDGPCTMDFVPHTTVFSMPMDVTTTEPLEVAIGDSVVTVPIK
ncbi:MULTISPECIES: hypothetical protein [unclassified Agromyces]|uniref:hypothetical protein n=1 Tax=unclassified Agromyces TaxID=2639701 RepID=UPI003014DDEA